MNSGSSISSNTLSSNNNNNNRNGSTMDIPRTYQKELFERSLKSNVIAVLGTGTGKTLIAVMLIKHLQSSKSIWKGRQKHSVSIFVVNMVPLVFQQAEVIRSNSTARVLCICSDMLTKIKSKLDWKHAIKKYDVIVLTAQIFLNALRRAYINLSQVNLIIFDEAHHARKNSPYSLIMKEFYERSLPVAKPKIFGMTASPDNVKELEATLNCKAYTICDSNSDLNKFAPKASEHVLYFNSPLWYPSTSFVQSVKNLAPLLCKGVFERYIRNAEFVLDTLGPWCSDAYLSYSLYEIISTSKWFIIKKMKSSAKPNIIKEELSRLENLDVIRKKPKTPLLSLPYLSSKVLCLVGLLQRFENCSDFCGILFCSRKTTALALYLVITSIPALSSFIRCSLLVGHGRQQEEDCGMRYMEQNKVISKFRNGKLNLLLATRVAEEGLDVQPCKLVIRFDFFEGVRSYIQSRGRARHRSSKFVILLEKGNTAQEYRLLNLKKQEKEMLNVCLETVREKATGEVHVEQDEERDEPPTVENQFLSMEEGEYYMVERTQSMVTLDSSVALLYHYCSLLPRDIFTLSNPIFNFSHDSDGYVAEIIMPKASPLNKIEIDKVYPSKQKAKKVAALKACQLLHSIGELDDHLQPVTIPEEEDILVSEKISLGMKVSVKVAIPSKLDSLFQRTMSDNTGTNCFVQIIEINMNSKDTPSQLFAFLTLKQLPVLPSLSIYSSQNLISVPVHCLPNPVLIPPKMLIQAMDFQSTLCNILYGKELYLSHVPFIIIPLNLMPTSGKEFLEQFYSIPHNMSKNTMDSSPPADLKWASLLFTNNESFLVHNSHSLESKASKISIPSKDLECGHFRPFLVSKTSAIPNCFLPSSPNVSMYISPDKKKLIAIPTSLYHSFFMLPSILYNLECFLHAEEIKNLINVDADLTLLLEAITSQTANQLINYERLEFLGDSFIKLASSSYVFATYPLKHEGKLTILRSSQYISNQVLFQHAESIGLPRHLIFSQFQHDHILSPCFNAFLNNETSSNVEIIVKQIADCVESIIGACYLSGGLDSALQCYISFGVDFGANKTWEDLRTYVALFKLQFFESDMHDDQDIFAADVIEGIIGYSFSQKRHLLEAFTHPSAINTSNSSYRRLGFLGDAVIDFLVVEYLFKKYPDLPPGRINELKMATVNSGAIGYLAIQLGLQQHIIHFSSSLVDAMTDFFSEVEKIDKTGQFWFNLYPPRVLSDVFDAMFGAIWLDSQFNLEMIRKAFDKIFGPFLSEFISPERVSSSFQKIEEYCHSNQCRDRVSFIKVEVLVDASCEKQKSSYQAMIHGQVIGTGSGKTRSMAIQLAALQAISFLEKHPHFFQTFCGCQGGQKVGKRKREEVDSTSSLPRGKHVKWNDDVSI